MDYLGLLINAYCSYFSPFIIISSPFGVNYFFHIFNKHFVFLSSKALVVKP